jgi:quercetin 2,3-dioxygenase
VTIHQDVDLYSATLDESAELTVELGEARNGFLQVARGAVMLDGEELLAGDAATMQGRKSLQLSARANSELLFFDLG